jgi:hypothetical protein
MVRLGQTIPVEAHNKKVKPVIVLMALCCPLMLSAQYSLGVSGLWTVPSAEMQPQGRFMAGVNYLPDALTPAEWAYDTGNYFFNISFLPFLEVAYRCTLIQQALSGRNGHYKWQQDRSVSLRLRPLKESRYFPSVVIGSNDAFTTHQLNPLQDVSGNRYFSSVFAVATKRVQAFSFTLGGLISLRKQAVEHGVFAGAAYAFPFRQPLSLVVEYDSHQLNAGLKARLFNHCSVHVFAYGVKALSGGIRYEFDLMP